MTRTRLIVLACVLLLGIGIPAWQYFTRGPSSEDCAPVVALLDYNREQSEQIQAKDADDALPGVAADSAYQQWADGLAQRAQDVTNPDLAIQAIQVADLASQFTVKLPQLRAATEAQAPGAPTPEIAYEMDALNTQIVNQLSQLSDACE